MKTFIYNNCIITDTIVEDYNGIEKNSLIIKYNNVNYPVIRLLKVKNNYPDGITLVEEYTEEDYKEMIDKFLDSKLEQGKEKKHLVKK